MCGGLASGIWSALRYKVELWLGVKLARTDDDGAELPPRVKIFCSSSTDRRRRKDFRFERVGLADPSTSGGSASSVEDLVDVATQSSRDGPGEVSRLGEAMDSAGDMGRVGGADSVATRVGEVGDISSSEGVAGRLLWFSLNELKSCPRVRDLRLEMDGDVGLGVPSSCWHECLVGSVAGACDSDSACRGCSLTDALR